MVALAALGGAIGEGQLCSVYRGDLMQSDQRFAH